MTAPFVLDASIAVCWGLADEHHRLADLALAQLRSTQALAPRLLWFELRNVLVVGERRKRLTRTSTDRFLQEFATLPVTLDPSPDESEVLRLARSHDLSVYDAAYVELARRERLPLATLDTVQAKAARAEGVAILGD